MNINFLNEFINSEYIYIVYIIVLIITLIMVFLKFKVDRKSKSIPRVEPIQEMKLPKPTTIQDEPLEKDKMELDSVLEQMRNNLMEQQEMSVKTFEEEQEEKSIISYQELLRANEKTMPSKEINDEKLTSIEESSVKFRNSEFISPIYGRVDNDVEYPTIPKIRRAKLESEEPIIEVEPKETINELQEFMVDIKEEQEESILDLENTISSHNLKEEMIKNEQFLNSLREFRKNLE